jgi:ATP-dependent HslUV protease subunit HslV
MADNDIATWHGTTILSVRKNGKVVVAGDGQVTFGNTVMKSNARKVRPLGDGGVIAGFAVRRRMPSRFLSGLKRSLNSIPAS